MIFLYEGARGFDGKRVKGFLQMIDGETYITPLGSFVARQVVPETVRAFIGRRDRNGHELFEYDVVRFILDEPEEDYSDSEYVILWDEEQCGFVVKWTESADEEDVIDTYFTSNCVLVGNALADPTRAGVHGATVKAAKSQSLRNLLGEYLEQRGGTDGEMV